jgi:hypothetical protein
MLKGTLGVELPSSASDFVGMLVLLLLCMLALIS